jgi:DNA-binding transcriptional LysR family regulator
MNIRHPDRARRRTSANTSGHPQRDEQTLSVVHPRRAPSRRDPPHPRAQVSHPCHSSPRPSGPPTTAPGTSTRLTIQANNGPHPTPSPPSAGTPNLTHPPRRQTPRVRTPSLATLSPAAPPTSDLPIDDLDLNLLRALERLLATASVTRAAADLGVGQPAASRALERLRGHLRDPLLLRAGRGMVLTERAQELLPRAREALDAVARAMEPLEPFDPATAVGVLRLALGDDAQTALTVPLVERLRAAAPGLDLRIRPVHARVGDALDRGQLDAVVFPDVSVLPGFRLPDLEAYVRRPLFTERFVVLSAVPATWTLDRYAAADHVLVAGDDDRGFIDHLLAERGLRRRVALTVPTFQQAVNAVASTDLIATLPAHAARATRHPLHAAEPPLPIPPLPMVMLWHPRTTASPRHRLLRQLLIEVAPVD